MEIKRIEIVPTEGGLYAVVVYYKYGGAETVFTGTLVQCHAYKFE